MQRRNCRCITLSFHLRPRARLGPYEICGDGLVSLSDMLCAYDEKQGRA